MLARFGNALALEPDRPIDGKQFELKELFSSKGALIKDRTRLTNRLNMQSVAPVKRQTKLRIDQITHQLKALQQDINIRLQDCPGRTRVVPPFSMGSGRRIQAAVFNFMAGVLPPMPMLGRSLLFKMRY